MDYNDFNEEMKVYEEKYEEELNKNKLPKTSKNWIEEILSQKDTTPKKYAQTEKLHPEKAIQTIEPITLNKESSKLLNRDINSLALKFDRKVYTKDQSILEYTISIFTSDKHQYQIMMTE